MSETVHEQIAQWIAAALDGVQDPDSTITLHSVRPKVLDWTIEDFKHGDVILEADSFTTESETTSTRCELAPWKCYGVIRELPGGIAADTMISRVIETIRRTLLAGNTGATACGGLAVSIDCPDATFSLMAGGVVAEVTVQVRYRTGLKDGYASI